VSKRHISSIPIAIPISIWIILTYAYYRILQHTLLIRYVVNIYC
jgi:hypothetical protein